MQSKWKLNRTLRPRGGKRGAKTRVRFGLYGSDNCITGLPEQPVQRVTRTQSCPTLQNTYNNPNKPDAGRIARAQIVKEYITRDLNTDVPCKMKHTVTISKIKRVPIPPPQVREAHIQHQQRLAEEKLRQEALEKFNKDLASELEKMDQAFLETTELTSPISDVKFTKAKVDKKQKKAKQPAPTHSAEEVGLTRQVIAQLIHKLQMSLEENSHNQLLGLLNLIPNYVRQAIEPPAPSVLMTDLCGENSETGEPVNVDQDGNRVYRKIDNANTYSFGEYDPTGVQQLPVLSPELVRWQMGTGFRPAIEKMKFWKNWKQPYKAPLVQPDLAGQLMVEALFVPRSHKLLMLLKQRARKLLSQYDCRLFSHYQQYKIIAEACLSAMVIQPVEDQAVNLLNRNREAWKQHKAIFNKMDQQST